MNLIESMSKYFGDNNVHDLPKGIDTKMHSLANKIKDYENAIWAVNKAIERTDLNQQYKRYRTELVKQYEIVKK